jgi:MOSC domain-containing protein YiiM
MSLNPESPLAQLMATLPQLGRLEWIGLRPARETPMQAVQSAQATTGGGLLGDRYQGRNGKRGITLIQAEHLPAIAALSGHATVAPATLRRNLVVSGIPLIALKGRRFRIGEIELEGTAPARCAWATRSKRCEPRSLHSFARVRKRPGRDQGRGAG